MHKISEIEKEIKSRMKPFLKEYGYVKNGPYSFVIKNENKFHKILWAIYDYGHKWITYRCDSGDYRIDRLRNYLYNEETNDVQAKGIFNYNTGTLFQAGLSPYRDFILNENDDLQTSDLGIEFFLNYHNNTFLPYISKINTIEEMEYEYNQGQYYDFLLKPKEIVTHFSLNDFVISNAYVLAKLVSQEKYYEIKERYTIYTINYSPELLYWHDFVSKIESYSTEELRQIGGF